MPERMEISNNGICLLFDLIDEIKEQRLLARTSHAQLNLRIFSDKLQNVINGIELSPNAN